MWDWLICGARVVDGTGNPWYWADVALEGNRIAAIGRLRGESALQRLDVDGLVLAPGFIDSHTHAEAYTLGRHPGARAKVAQGVTTDIMGLCGLSAFPVVNEHRQALEEYLAGATAGEELPWEWQGHADLVSFMSRRELLLNAGSMVGHGSVRLAVMGPSERAAEPEQLRRMQAMVAQALREGAIGVSFGLVYPPGCFAGGNEVIGVAQVAAQMGRPCAMHIRSEADELLDSIAEAIEISRFAGCRLVISHLKAAGKANWGGVKTALAVIERARDAGIDVRADAYPYLAGCPWITALLPRWANEGGISAILDRLRDASTRRRIAAELETSQGDWENLVRVAGWDNIVLLGFTADRRFEGKSVEALAVARGCSSADAFMDVIIESEGEAVVGVFDLSQGDVEAAISHPLVMIASDGGPSSGLAHPRLHGTFPRVLNDYVRSMGALSLETAVRKMTSYVAQTYNLWDRGLIAPGLRADLTLFDPGSIIDTSTYEEPDQMPRGIEAVFVGGEPVLLRGEWTGMTRGEPVLVQTPCY